MVQAQERPPALNTETLDALVSAHLSQPQPPQHLLAVRQAVEQGQVDTALKLLKLWAPAVLQVQRVFEAALVKIYCHLC